MRILTVNCCTVDSLGLKMFEDFMWHRLQVPTFQVIVWQVAKKCLGSAPDTLTKPGQLLHFPPSRVWYLLQMRHSGLWEPVGHTHLLVFLLHVAELLHAEAAGTQVPCLKYCNEVLADATMSTRPSPSKSASWNWNITSPVIEISAKGFFFWSLNLPFPCCWKYKKCLLVDLATSARTKSKSPSLSMSTTAGQKAPKLISLGKAVLTRGNQLRQFNLTFDPPIRGQFTTNKFTYGPQKGHLEEPGRKRSIVMDLPLGR